MRKIGLLLIFIIPSVYAFTQLNHIEQSTQSKRLDSLKKELSKSKDDTATVMLYLSLASAFYSYTSMVDSGYFYADKAEVLSKKMKWKTGEGVGQFSKLWYYYDTYNYPKALAAALSGLKILEDAKDTLSIAGALDMIRVFYTMIQDYANSIPYSHRLLTIGKMINDTIAIGNGLFGLAEAYYYMKMSDSALKYFEDNYHILNRSNFIGRERDLAWAYSGLSKVYNQMNEKDLAMSYLKKGLQFAATVYDSSILKLELYATLSDIYLKENNYDSALKYAYLSLNSPPKPQQAPTAFTLLSQIYEHINKDSAINYYKMVNAINDSLFNTKTKTQVASLTQNEIERQKQIQEEQKKLTSDRKRNIQYTAIAIGVVTLIILFLLYSGSIIGKEKFIKYLGILVLLIVFEFINLFIHPFLAHATDESPLLMLLTMVAIAAVLIPLHHRIEHWVSHQLVERNKRVRLEAAKKIIRQLEK
jgi:tetratricopeptide (TPR) repeat protein